MEFDWKDVQEEGVLPEITCPADYQIGIHKGLGKLYAALEQLAAPIFKPDDLKP